MSDNSISTAQLFVEENPSRLDNVLKAASEARGFHLLGLGGYGAVWGAEDLVF